MHLNRPGTPGQSGTVFGFKCQNKILLLLLLLLLLFTLVKIFKLS